ncbi:GntR family transcriptional regulator [Tuberibacillus sp. Marseille-P3662]|uniref:GntR family transcriptional regulator n=1 Tax=Tuberibacillus sp. Marseille-P3662 TaxID=1965358 RepID=UPI000A1CD03A|nr:GntR family transcriptional regulator [Tuberibacillus sp. Marseille-P3662]
MIDKNSPVPIYFQIEEYIKSLVDNNQLKIGETIPSEREFTEQFNVSRMTVRQAITNLVNQGYLYRIKGRGTFVGEKKMEQTLHTVTSFTEDMKERGLTPSTKLAGFQIMPADDELAEQLQISVHEPVYEIKRIRLADDEPMALECTYIPANEVQGLTETIASHSLYAYIEEQMNYQIDYANQVIESTLSGQDEKECLNVGIGEPILSITRKTYLTNGKVLEWVKSNYRADRYKFAIKLTREP